MLFRSPPPQSPSSPPFTILLQAQDATVGGHFRPTASVILTPGLRTSGLLRELLGEELKTLLLVLTFVSANGHCLPTLPELSEGLRLSSSKMKARLERLQACTWLGDPLVHLVKRESGLHAYGPSLSLLATEAAPMPAGEENQAPLYRAAGREAVIAHSRATYTRPRAEVEREIALLNGWPLPEQRSGEPLPQPTLSLEEKERDYLRQRLLRLGVSGEQADFLLASYSAESIMQQLDWLPYRNAKKPAAFVVAAIEGDYEEPPHLRRRRALEETLVASSQEFASAPPTVEEAENTGTSDAFVLDVPEVTTLQLPRDTAHVSVEMEPRKKESPLLPPFGS